ncbi:hypothetical protein ABEB36_014415 [Hypothenemus hampei]|uniref:SWIM-type domain-containing protein n=1 Tax=Hypothenemus hampei TaxID=57062 RepID=A0ABD1E3S6_HYPHA
MDLLDKFNESGKYLETKKLDELEKYKEYKTSNYRIVKTSKYDRFAKLVKKESDIQKINSTFYSVIYKGKNNARPIYILLCDHHLDADGYVPQNLLDELMFINRPYLPAGKQLQQFLGALRQEAQQNDPSFGDESTFSDDEFSAISPISRDQFQDLYIHCVPVSVQEGNVHKNRNISKKNLLTFLCKMKQGLSDDLLRVIFKYSCRQAVHRAISLVRRSLMLDFVPHNLGLASITRAQYIERHVTSFSNELYNPSPENPVAIMIIDGTYAHLEKSSNFQSLRQSFSMHKHDHLIKPALVVAPDGFILDIHGPYYSDSSNNDAAMLRNQLENGMGLREWLNDGDIIIVDRGYRDVLPFLDNLGIEYKMPALLQQGQRQLNTEEANDSRLVTKTRWIVEARNGHIKSVFKFFKGKISIVHAENLGDFYRIAAALLNKYRKPIVMSGADLELARKMLVRSRTPNVLQARLEVDHALRTRHAGWVRLTADHAPRFPYLDLDYLKDLTLGVYQLNLAPAYIQDKLQREDLEVFEFDEFLNEPGLIRCRIYSRFRNATKYEVWIGYWLEDVDEEVAEQDGGDVFAGPISGYYCTCKSGTRTLGTCAHIASILWFLGYARHQQRIKYPRTTLLERTIDIRQRF